jgi:hypothetical protein
VQDAIMFYEKTCWGIKRIFVRIMVNVLEYAWKH